MTRLLHASGDTALAKRTLRLYIQVVGKAWQANNETEGGNTDTNQYWVETLVAGARMLCRSVSSNPGLEGIEDVREAGTCVEKARTRLDAKANDDVSRRLRASVDLAEGIWGSVLAIKGLSFALYSNTMVSFLPHRTSATYQNFPPRGSTCPLLTIDQYISYTPCVLPPCAFLCTPRALTEPQAGHRECGDGAGRRCE